MSSNGAMNRIGKIQESIRFSGTFYVKSREPVLTGSYGFANRSEKIKQPLDMQLLLAVKYSHPLRFANWLRKEEFLLIRK